MKTSGISSGSNNSAAIQILQKAMESQVNLSEKLVKTQVAQVAHFSKLDTIGQVVDLYA